MSYICISHASADGRVVNRFCHEMTMYGYSFVCIDEHTPGERRDQWLTECAILLILTSPQAVAAGSCATDLRRAAGSNKVCVCISLSPNELDERYCGTDAQGAIPMIPYPGGATETPDERSVALFVHRLYIRRLSRLDACFSPLQCVDDPYGRVILLTHKARRGDAKAQFDLGCAYEAGQGLPVLESEAARWFNRAASGGNTDAMIRMGELRLDGEGVERDHAEALRLFSAAARAGDRRGQFAKGICCLYGYGLMKDPEMAIRYFRAAAAEGYIPAFYRLGLLYRDGVGIAKNHRLAVKYLYLAAVGDTQNPPYLYGARFAPQPDGTGTLNRKKYVCVSMRYMRQKTLQGLLMAHEDHPVPTDGTYKFCQVACRGHRVAYPENAWLEAGVGLFGTDPGREDTNIGKAVVGRKCDYSHQNWDPALAESALGRLLELGSTEEGIHPSPRGALIWYRRAIARGHSGAMFRLGDAYRSGRGVLSDPQQGVRLFRRSADLGHDRGRFAMGVCCEGGNGIIADPQRAVSWYELSAKAGYAPAQNNLGGCYEYGIGVPVDYLSAVEWYTRASAGGEPNATCRLGMCYENGRGVSQSHERAFRLYEDAARHKHAYALYRLALYYDRGLTVTPQVAYAAHLYERAAKGGVGDAAYAMALCCGEGRGVRRDLQAGMDWLKAAAALGSVQGCYALGMAYFEGTLAVQNRQAAKDAFLRAVQIYESMNPRIREDGDKLLPANAVTMTEAVGKALYMLGYGLVCDGRGKTDPRGALTYFKKAASAGCSEAMTAIGDLYAYGLLDAGSEEKNQSAALKAYEAAAKEHQMDALLSLAARYAKMGEDAAKGGDIETGAAYKEAAFRCLNRAASQGDAYALVGMAGSFWLGNGTKRNRDAAYDYLRRANGISDGPTHGKAHKVAPNGVAALCLGDLYWTAITTGATEQTAACINAARDAYQRAIKASRQVSREPMHVIPARKEQRLKREAEAGAAAHHRLAVLCLTYGPPDTDGEEIYSHLGAAVLAGHKEALDDMAGFYVYRMKERERQQTQAVVTGGGRRSKRSSKEALAAEDEPSLIKAFGRDYHALAHPVPVMFDVDRPLIENRDAESLPFGSDIWTDTLRAEALNYLADCYFYGRGLPKDQSAAVILYRRAASVKQGRGEPVSGGIVWAQYSLGYCLLQGIGVSQNPREAVQWLTAAAKYHGSASLCLAQCHLEGVGVDRKDIQEALKYYRRALKFGCAEAEDAIARLKKINS